MGEVIEGDFITTLDIPVPRVIKGLDEIKDEVERIIVIGYYPNGEYFFASSTGDGPLICWDLEQIRHMIAHGEVSG